MTASINLDSNTLKFANPLAVLYLDKPSKELVEQVVQAARRLSPAQVPEFVGLAAAILKSYKARQDNVKDADSVRPFLRSISSSFSRRPSCLENPRFSTIHLSIFK